MSRVFEVSKSCHGMRCIQADDMTADECLAVRRIVGNQWCASKDYQVSRASHAFLQGFELPREGKADGWCLVEFWTGDDAKIKAFVDHVNAELAQERG